MSYIQWQTVPQGWAFKFNTSLTISRANPDLLHIISKSSKSLLKTNYIIYEPEDIIDVCEA